MGYINPVGFILTIREDKSMSIKPTWENIQLTDEASSVNENFKVWKTCGWLPEQLVNHGLAVVTQPVFIDGAEYSLYDSSGHGEPTRVRYEVSTNTFYEVNKPFGLKAPASNFGKDFTVELVTPETPETPDYILTGKGNINALSNYLKMIPTSSTDEIAGEALSRLKAQAVIVGRIGKLNEVCQKHSIGSIGDSVIDSIVEHVEKQNSLYERIVKVLGERKVPIGGIDHLVGQVQVDHKKATLLDKVIEEFKIPEGGNVIKWLHNRTELTPVPTTVNLRAQPRNKYDREILPGVHVDVYDVLGVFKTDSAAIDHAVKKLLAPGHRGVKDRITDLNEAINSIQREIDRVNEWGNK